LEHLADVDDDGAVERRDVDQLPVALDLETADSVLMDERQESRVAVGADALAGGVGSAPVTVATRVADHLEQHLGRRHGRCEVVRRQRQRRCHGTEQPPAEDLERVHPRRRRGTQLRQRGRPQVRPAQAQPRRLVGAGPAIGLLPADVDLVACVDLAVGPLGAVAGVATELG
jgi:hypothetical protein